MFGNFYAGFKPRFWWFFVLAHGINDILLSWLGVVMAKYPFEMNVVTATMLTLYAGVLVVFRPYDASMDLAVDLSNIAVALLAIGMAEIMSASKGSPSPFIIGCLWLNVFFMIVFTLQGLWPLVPLAKEAIVEHVNHFLVWIRVREEDPEEDIKKVEGNRTAVRSGDEASEAGEEENKSEEVTETESKEAEEAEEAEEDNGQAGAERHSCEVQGCVDGFGTGLTFEDLQSQLEHAQPEMAIHEAEVLHAAELVAQLRSSINSSPLIRLKHSALKAASNGSFQPKNGEKGEMVQCNWLDPSSPALLIDMGTWSVLSYTEEQQARLGVNWQGDRSSVQALAAAKENSLRRQRSSSLTDTVRCMCVHARLARHVCHVHVCAMCTREAPCTCASVVARPGLLMACKSGP
jgi:hypothetical protein